ncbi:MAG: hypothetical protein DWQ05_02510 [Calditrichaeota bacterium]|nr:MAG: hypothetical protein DWQ05_02510 [Calditrichota bacterium]
MGRSWLRFLLLGIPVVFLQAFQPDTIFSQQKTGELDMSMMDKDLNIMESILDKLLSEDDYRRIHLTHSSTRGIFIPSYGVIFTVPIRRPIFQVLTERFHQLQMEEEEHVAIISTENSRSPQKKATREETELKINYFLGKYADAIRQLRGQDKITVIYSDQSMNNAGSNWQSASSFDSGFTSSIAFNTIQQFNAGKINRRTFDNLVSVNSEVVTHDRQPEIGIFINAMQTILHSRSAETFDLRGGISQFHLADFGVIFSFQANFLSSNSLEYFFSVDPNSAEFSETRIIRGKKGKTGTGINVWTQFSHIDTVSTAQLIKAFSDFENKLQHLITQYAPTLDVEKPESWLVLAVKIDQLNPQIPTRAVYKIQNKNIQALMDRKISREKLINEIESYKYYPIQ